MVPLAETGAGNGGDAYADYQRSPLRTVDGKAIAWDAKLSGNFARFKLLKAAHPNLRVFISLGGWSWSKHFSEAARTDVSRKQLARSCVKQFIAGDLPVQDGGGPGAAKVSSTGSTSTGNTAAGSRPPTSTPRFTTIPPIRPPGSSRSTTATMRSRH